MMKLLNKWFKSIKLAVVLILILSILSLIGIFLPQIPHEFSSSPDGYNWWLENVARGEFGGFTPILAFWGLFNIFTSIWFLGIVVLLLINITVCSLGRFNSLKVSSAKVEVKKDLNFYNNSKFSANLITQVPIESTKLILEKILKKRHYFLTENMDEKKIYIAGHKNRFSAFGTYAVHLSLFVFILGILLGTFFGFRNNTFVVTEDQSVVVGYDTKLSLYLKSFDDEYWEDGTPKDYRSEVVLYENGKEVKKGLVRVNHPLEYKGVRFNQSFFGPAIELKIEDSDSKIVFNDTVKLTRLNSVDSIQRPEGNFNLTDNGYIVNVIGNAMNGADPAINKDEIAIDLYDSNQSIVDSKNLKINEPQKIGDLTFTLLEKLQYSGFIVSKDPGNIFIWIGSFLFIVGIVIVFYFPNRQIWIVLDSFSKKGTTILIRLNSAKKLTLENERSAIISELENNLDIKRR